MTTPTPLDDLRIEVADAQSSEATALMARLTAELARRYEDDGVGDFTIQDVLQPRSVFLLGWLSEQPVACGALRPLQAQVAEIKRMYVEPSVRGRGIAKRLLAELERHARHMGYTIVRLETGVAQPEALRVYESGGYRRIENYGFHREDSRTVCFEKQVAE